MFRKLFLGLALCALAVAMFIDPVLASSTTAFFADAFASAGVQYQPALAAAPQPSLALISLAVIVLAAVAVFISSHSARRRVRPTGSHILPPIARYRLFGPAPVWRST